MIDRKMNSSSKSKELPYSLMISTLRRKKILNILTEQNLMREDINKTLNAFSQLLNRQRNTRHKVKDPTSPSKTKKADDGFKFVKKDQ